MNTFQCNAYPKPLVPICVKLIYDALDIYVSTQNARRWLFKVAPKFGEFDLYDDSTHRFYLRPYGTYNLIEVKEFLESYVEL